MRTFSARETGWQQELDGIELAAFWPRAIAFAIDWLLVLVAIVLVSLTLVGGYFCMQKIRGHSFHETATRLSDDHQHYQINIGAEIGVQHAGPKTLAEESMQLVADAVVPVAYFGIALWWGRGRTPGKRLAKVRVVSIVHPHLSFWHAVERALGYGAAALELGFGFVQFFIHPYRRCAQDRLAETIVVTERGYRAMEHKFKAHAAIGDAEQALP